MTPSVPPIKPGDLVKRVSQPEVFVATACVWDETAFAWDVTAARKDGSLIGEYAHNMEYVDSPEDPDV